MAIYVLKLQSGAEVMASINDIQGSLTDVWHQHTTLSISDPVIIVPNQENGSVGAMPFTFAGIDDNVTIPTSAILCILEPKTALKENYIREVVGGQNSSDQNTPERSPLMM